VHQWSAECIQLLQTNLDGLLRADVRASTQRAYDTHVRQFLEFCQVLSRAPIPAAEAVAQFVLGRAYNGYKLSYIKLGVHALARWARDHHGLSPITAAQWFVR
jgi:hypothetical protein